MNEDRGWKSPPAREQFFHNLIDVSKAAFVVPRTSRIAAFFMPNKCLTGGSRVKKIIVLLLGLCSGMAWSAPRQIQFVDPIGPTTSTAQFISIASSTVTGTRTCLTEVRSSIARNAVQANLQLNILNGGTTIYTLDASTGNPVQMFWNETDPFCITPNYPLVLTTTATASGVTINTNYKGYSY